MLNKMLGDLLYLLSALDNFLDLDLRQGKVLLCDLSLLLEPKKVVLEVFDFP